MDTRIGYLKTRKFLDIHPTTLKQVNSIGAITTKFYGPIWFSLFIMIIGQYPVEMDWNNQEHVQVATTFYHTLTGLQYTLPCKFCRKSFSDFMKELNIKEFMDSRISMMLWLYLMKDKVNMKLLNQEREYLETLSTSYKKGKISKAQYLREKKLCFNTVPSPPFEEILKYYIKYRATCSAKIKKCVGKDDVLAF